MKKVAILGSTGSIGTQTLDVIRRNPDKFKVVALTCGNNIDKLSEQIQEFEPEIAYSCNVNPKEDRKRLIEVATCDCDIVVNGLMGMVGLEPTYYAINAGKDVAFANKETLVVGGEVIMKAVKDNGVKLLPVDSEHSAIFQCLEGNKDRKIKKILLTASGGPFRGYTKEMLEHVTLEQALNHPKWSMGKKITVDSATMMNKGLEVIEAKWLFDVDPDNIEILVHPQSIVHSAVEFMDNSIIAQMGIPDMRIPISLALGYPERLNNPDRELDMFTEGANLTFEKPDRETFKCIDIAYDAIKKGGSYPVVMNAANEVLVAKFLRGEIRFIDIPNTILDVMSKHEGKKNLSISEIVHLDREVREELEKK